ncbi:MAG: hypothetical protein ACPG5O_04130 [Pseudoalteromonas tetraodonis]
MEALQVNINKKQISFPLTWKGLNKSQLVNVAYALRETWKWESINALTEADKDHVASEILKLKAFTVKILLGVSWKVYDRMNCSQLAEFIPHTNWLFEQKYPNALVLPEFQHRFVKYTLHNEGLTGWTLTKYLTVEKHLQRVMKTATEESLLNFLAQICTNKKGENPAAKKLKGINPNLASALMLQYLGARKRVVDLFPHVFPQSENTKNEGDATNWGVVISEFIAPKYGNNLNIAKDAPLYDALGVLNTAIQKNKEMAKKYKEAQK